MGRDVCVSKGVEKEYLSCCKSVSKKLQECVEKECVLVDERAYVWYMTKYMSAGREGYLWFGHFSPFLVFIILFFFLETFFGRSGHMIRWFYPVHLININRMYGWQYQ